MGRAKKKNKKESVLGPSRHLIDVSIEEKDSKTKSSELSNLDKIRTEEQKEKVKIEEQKEQEVSTIEPIQDPGAKTIREQITDAEQFPSWHPYHKKLHMDLYKSFQNSATQVFPEPIYKRDEIIYQDFDPFYDLLHPSLEFELSYTFVEFFGACLNMDNVTPFHSIYAQNWEDLVTIPLFYLHALIPAFSTRYMCFWTCAGKGLVKMF